jgi:hypothetical protein
MTDCDFALDETTHDRRLVVRDGYLDFALITGREAIRQRIKVTLRWFQGEFFADASFGTPWFQQIIGREKSLDHRIAAAVLTRRVREIPGVVDVKTVHLEFDRTTRALTLYLAVTTIEGDLEFQERY